MNELQDNEGKLHQVQKMGIGSILHQAHQSMIQVAEKWIAAPTFNIQA